MNPKDYQIDTDGRTVWVNGPEQLVGRFCRISAEVMLKNGELCQRRNTAKAGLSVWRWFSEVMKLEYGIEVADNYRPEYAR